uniref:Aminopeptidase n=1 Tax=Chenopodium quinoa TaxID=63459 RepID=A0A803LR57_CHEQI
MKKKKEFIRLDRESVIPIFKPKLIHCLTQLIESESERAEFLTFCNRVDYTIRAWYLIQFEELMQLFKLFEPVAGARKLEECNFPEDKIELVEEKFLALLFKMLEKSNFKMVTNEEFEVAASENYCLNLPIKVDEAKLDTTLLKRFFAKHPRDNLPHFAKQYIIFRRGFGMDRKAGYFAQWKIDALISRIAQGFLRLTGLKSTEDGRAIYVKHFKHIPMADMEIVLPEKKSPGLTSYDWFKLLVSAAIGLVTVITQLCQTTANLKVLATVGSAVVCYCAKIYFTFQANLSDYHSLITQSMYDKQLDSGRGTLLHLCDNVLKQEVKEVIIAFFVLMKYGNFNCEDLDRKCEELILEQFNEQCDFDVNDAIDKLEKLGIVYKDQSDRYSSLDVKKANDVIGTTTEEIVKKASRGDEWGDD